MDAIIECKPVHEATDPLLDRVELTYNSSFPEDERRAFSLIRELIKEEPRFALYTLHKNSEYAGFITTWKLDDFSYVEHFAIDETARNSGIGAKAMKQFMALCSHPIVLEVELPAEEMSKRRVGFYERLGFVLDHHSYQQPPYREGDSWLEMRLMTHGPLDLEASFETVRDLLYRHVYGVRS